MRFIMTNTVFFDAVFFGVDTTALQPLAVWV